MRYCISFGLLFVSLGLSQHATCQSFDATFCKEDVRLQKRMNIALSKVCVGELLEKLSAQSGISLLASERDGAADEVVAIQLHDAPLADVLDALWSLVSYKGASWSWSRETIDSKYVYRLSRPLAAQQFGPKLRADIQAQFEGEADAYLAALNASPSERAKLAKEDPRIDAMTKDHGLSEGLGAFFESFPADQRQSILRGDQAYNVPINQLGPLGTAFLKSTSDGYRQNNGSIARDPQSMSFRTFRVPGSLSPSLYIQMGDMGGNSFIGGSPLNNKCRDKLYNLWMLTGDDEHNGAESKQIHTLSPSEISAGEAFDNNPLRRRLKLMADNLPISFIARLPAKDSYCQDPGDPAKLVLGDFLKKVINTPPRPAYKWRGGVLLVSQLAWIYDEGTYAPWRIVKRVNRSGIKERGWFNVFELISIAGALSVEEIKSIKSEYPSLNGVATMYSLFYKLSSAPTIAQRITTERGVPVEELLPELRAISTLSLAPYENSPKGITVRLRESEREGTHYIDLHLLSQEGRVIGGIGFINKSRQNSPAVSTKP